MNSLLKKPPCNDIEEHIKKVNGSWIIDEVGEQIIINSFRKDEQPSNRQLNNNYSTGEQLVNEDVHLLKTQIKSAIDEISDEKILMYFKEDEQPNNNQIQKDEQLFEQMNNEITTLKEQLKFANEHNAEVNKQLNQEREHSRKQSEEIINMNKQLIEITRNNQILLQNEQIRAGVYSLPAPDKENFFKRLFKNKK
jgi:hypothetical protein